MKKPVSEQKLEYKEYLNTLGIGSLRSLGRHVGVSKSTEKKKSELIDLIIAVLVGELAPVPQTNRGAPVKAEEVNPKILLRLSEIGAEKDVSGYTEEDFNRYNNDMKNAFENLAKPENKNTLTVSAPDFSQEGFQPTVYVGQVGHGKNFYYLLPLNAKDDDIKIILEEEKAEEYGVKDGDVISCQTEQKGGFLVVTRVLTVNETFVSEYQRQLFEETEIIESQELLPLKNCKYTDWFFPIPKGRRALIVAPPKAGKTTLLRGLAKELIDNGEVKTFGLLIEQSFETVSEFKKIFSPYDLVCTTYEDVAEAHVFAAEFLLKRAKRYAETGKDVVLIIEGLQAFAKAYDEVNYTNEKMLSCGLSVKTLRYIKKYLATGRALKDGGSLTVICTSTAQTGNIEDDLFNSEISSVFGTRIFLNNEYAIKRIFPAVDVMRSYSVNAENLLTPYKNTVDSFIRGEYLPKFDGENLCRLVSESETLETLYEKAKLAIEKN